MSRPDHWISGYAAGAVDLLARMKRQMDADALQCYAL